MFRQAIRSQSPAYRHFPLAERSACGTPWGRNEIAAGARWKRFLLAQATASGLETLGPGAAFPGSRSAGYG